MGASGRLQPGGEGGVGCPRAAQLSSARAAAGPSPLSWAPFLPGRAGPTWAGGCPPPPPPRPAPRPGQPPPLPDPASAPRRPPPTPGAAPSRAPGRREVCAARGDAEILQELFGGGYLEIRPCEGPRVQIRRLGRSSGTGRPPAGPRRRDRVARPRRAPAPAPARAPAGGSARSLVSAPRFPPEPRLCPPPQALRPPPAPGSTRVDRSGAQG